MEEEIRFEETGLTKEKLKKYKGLENLTDEQATEIVSAIKKFSQLTFRYFRYVKEACGKSKNRKRV
jgi:hypothetical protein